MTTRPRKQNALFVSLIYTQFFAAVETLHLLTQSLMMASEEMGALFSIRR